MIAINCSSNIPKINDKMSPAKCLDIMIEEECFELPVFRDNQIYGTIQMEDCMYTIEPTIETLIIPGFVSIYYQAHIFEVLQVFKSSPRSVCAVLGDDLKWMGIITKQRLSDMLSQSLTIEQNGALLILEMSSLHYSSYEISRIVEGEGSKVLGFWLHKNQDSARIRVSIKLNTSNVERIVNGFDRFGYDIISIFGDEDYNENVKRKFQSFMKYLDD